MDVRRAFADRVDVDFRHSTCVFTGRLLAALWITLAIGCSTTDWVKVREKPNIPLAAELDLFSWTGPKPTPRTLQTLRRYDLQRRLHGDPVGVVSELQRICAERPSPENVFATAEIAYITGRRSLDAGRVGEALDMYGVAVANTYAFLLDDEFDRTRNPFDPQFRRASDIYNGALESAMRIVQKRGQLKPGLTHVIATETQQYEVTIQCRGRWRPEAIAALKFVSDYEVQGLKNHYRSFGLGVPMIAVHSGQGSLRGDAKYYAPGMSFPVTAFLQVLPDVSKVTDEGKHRRFCVLELHDPLATSDLILDGRMVPLETDLSTPLAYSLNDPTFQRANFATRGLLNPAESTEVQGLYMLEPYDPDRIPVLMIHGLWSNLITWMEMFNDLRGTPDVRNNFQFWFYLYPTGQPYWVTAAQLRAELAQVRRDLDPSFQTAAMDHLVLVGHSMGGLIARMQTIESGRDFWDLVSEEPVGDLSAPDHIVANLRRVLYFGPNPSVKRVISIASPHRGSRLSNGATQWLGRRLINLPETFLRTVDQVAGISQERASGLLDSRTSIDSLSPESPILQVMSQARTAPWVRYHNILGVVDNNRFLSRMAGNSDGIVTKESARLEGSISEVTVTSDHMNIHRHPKTVLEVQRILLEHLDAIDRTAGTRSSMPTVSRLPVP